MATRGGGELGVVVHPTASVSLPAESPVLRTPPADVPKHLTAEDLVGFDYWTLFSDVFVDRRGRLRAVGPPLGNLVQDLPQLEVLVPAIGAGPVGARRVHQRRERWVHDFALKVPRQEPFEVLVRAGEVFETSVMVDPSRFRAPLGDVTLVTLQKNNEPSWVRQWIEYHASLGVSDFVIYDNGSANFDDLVVEVGKTAEVQVQIVEWPFPYGPRTWKKAGYARRASIEHWVRAFGGNSWYLGTDIDEYLVLGDREVASVPAFLNSLPRYVGMCALHHYGVPAVEPTTPSGLVPTAADYPLRDRALSSVASQKYFARARLPFDLGVHKAKVRPLRTVTAPASQLYFLHYGGLSTDWKGDDRTRVRSLEEVDVVEDRSVIDVFDALPIHR